jgi:hypothetical protein
MYFIFHLFSPIVVVNSAANGRAGLCRPQKVAAALLLFFTAGYSRLHCGSLRLTRDRDRGWSNARPCGWQSHWAVVGTLIGTVACFVYAYLLRIGPLMPSVTTISTLTVVAAVVCGLQGGLFYAFSTAVMLALARQPHPSGMATMQTINVIVFNPWFGGAFALAPVACALAMITALARWPAPEAPGWSQAARSS